MTGRPGFPGKGGDAVEREEFADLYAVSFQRLVGQLYAMIGDQSRLRMPCRRRSCGLGRAAARSTGTERPRPGSASRPGASRSRGGAVPATAPGSGRWLPGQSPPPGPPRTGSRSATPCARFPLNSAVRLVLYHLCDLTVDQIAAETGVRAGTVKARLARGRAALAPYLRETATPVTE